MSDTGMFNTLADGLETASRGVDVIPFDLLCPGVGTIGDELGAGGLYALSETCRWANDMQEGNTWNMVVRPLTASLETAIVMCPFAEYPIEAINAMAGINLKKLPSDTLLKKSKPAVAEEHLSLAM